jgi:presenilin-like A22 family membrane protease
MLKEIVNVLKSQYSKNDLYVPTVIANVTKAWRIHIIIGISLKAPLTVCNILFSIYTFISTYTTGWQPVVLISIEQYKK